MSILRRVSRTGNSAGALNITILLVMERVVEHVISARGDPERDRSCVACAVAQRARLNYDASRRSVKVLPSMCFTATRHHSRCGLSIPVRKYRVILHTRIASILCSLQNAISKPTLRSPLRHHLISLPYLPPTFVYHHVVLCRQPV